MKTFNDKQTPLHYAAKYNGIDAMQILIRHGADVNVVDAMERSPLFLAAEYGMCDIFYCLIFYSASWIIRTALT